MGALFISFLTIVLILISAFVILLVLMQRTSQSGGMGAALGGGAAESAFGSDTNSVLTKATIYSIIAFFIVSLGLFLIYQSKAADRVQTVDPTELIQASEVDTAEEPLVTLEADIPKLEIDPTLLNTETIVDEANDTTVDAKASVEAVEVKVPDNGLIEEPIEEASQTSE